MCVFVWDIPILTDFVYAALQLCAAVASWMSVAAIPPLYLSPNDQWLYL